MGLRVRMANGASGTDCVVVLDGVLTAATVSLLEGPLALHLAVRPPVLVLDLTALHVCDATGAAMISAAAGAGRDCGVAVVLAAAPPAVVRALEIAGVLDTVPMYRTVSGATRQDPYERLGDRSPA
jgi:anti-sigma B factor antagonist